MSGPLPVVDLHVHVPTWLAVLIFLTLVAWVLWDVFAGQSIRDQVEAAVDDADKAVRRIEAVENHLTGLEPRSAGRHASHKERGYERLL